MDCFSPTFAYYICASHADGERNHLDDHSKSSITDKPDNLYPDNCPTSPKHFTTKSSMTQKISVDDVLCAACKEMLFQPVVLNCGHVYCETCIVPANGAVRCHICQIPQPPGFPKVFLELNHFLKEEFPKEYMARKCMGELRKVQFHGSSEAGKKTDPISFPNAENFSRWLHDNDTDLHIGIGCDTCGMCPIIGKRYRCIDCKEEKGFDVCGDCYNTCSKLPGRFNQQHTADHRFELENSRNVRRLLL
ncbi:hypothetical protein NMG60_11034538 [Bertholletia excelsa]